MTVEELYNQRLQRIKTAMDLGTPDRIPIHLGGPSFIRYAEPEATLSDYVLRPKWADDAVFRSYKMLPEIDTAPMLVVIMKAWGQCGMLVSCRAGNCRKIPCGKLSRLAP